VLVGVDSTPAATAAVEQGAILAGCTGTLELMASYDAAQTREEPAPIFLDAVRDRDRAQQRLLALARALPAGIKATTTVVPGRLDAVLVDELEIGHEGLVVVAADMGATAAEVLHRSPCSVLLARPGVGWPPQSIVVGVDGSPESARAYATGRDLAARFGAQLTAFVACGGPSPGAEDSPVGPASALLEAAERADLLILGQRGRHGSQVLGPVAAQLAHEAPCSVLVVRSTKRVRGRQTSSRSG
jgi:nucleotide-binding universal stress UspA family protein